MGKSWKQVNSTFRRYSWLPLSYLYLRLGSWNRQLAQAQALWDPVMPPSDGRPPPNRHGLPQPPSAAAVGVGGAWDRTTPQKSCHGTIGPVPSH